MSFKIKANFFGDFKIGDNINYNLEVLNILYEAYSRLSDGYKLIKPIVIFNTAIIEAILYDFIENRIRNKSYGDPIFLEITPQLPNKKADKFKYLIEKSQDYDFFLMEDKAFYNDMDFLRKMRNRIHIQNGRFEEPRKEQEIYHEGLKILSEKILEKVIKTMTFHYEREKKYNYVKDFELPWNEHFI